MTTNANALAIAKLYEEIAAHMQEQIDGTSGAYFQGICIELIRELWPVEGCWFSHKSQLLKHDAYKPLKKLYSNGHAYWFGQRTAENQQRRVHALLFAAEMLRDPDLAKELL
jgi:hypothetical protein